MRPLLPGLGLALFGLWAGTFFHGAGGVAATCGLAALLLAAWWGRAWWSDPLALGVVGRLLPWGLWLTLGASLWASPVPRAGWLATFLFPAFLLLAAATARCWSGPTARGRGLALVAVVVAVTALWALGDWIWLGAPRPAMPLGHHALLATWLVTLLPLAGALAVAPGWRRWLGAGSCGLAASVVVLSGSLAGWAALAGQAFATFVGIVRGKRRWTALGLALAAVLVAGVAAGVVPRLERVARGVDPSLQARAVYYEAGWVGFGERPLLGWGPGSASWLLARTLRPQPGVNPPGELVGDLHSLPLQVLFELGATGGLLTLGLLGLFAWRRLRELPLAADRALLAGGLLGLGGFLVARLAGGELAVAALPLAAAVAAGACLAGSGVRPPGGGGGGILVYLLVVAVAAAPARIAHCRYDEAIRGHETGDALRHLDRAIAWDPDFPLYGARAAWVGEGELRGDAERARLALAAAERGVAVAPLWLGAGVLGAAADEPWAEAALERAWELDPFGALAPFHLVVLRPEDPRAPCRAAAAVLREPRLLAARFWQHRPELRARAVESLVGERALAPWWREELARSLDGLRPPAPDSAELGLTLDHEAAVSLSLHLFRRRPWSGRLATVTVDRVGAEALALVPATVLAAHPRELFLERCPGDADESAGSVENPVEEGPSARRPRPPPAHLPRIAQPPVQVRQVFCFL